MHNGKRSDLPSGRYKSPNILKFILFRLLDLFRRTNLEQISFGTTNETSTKPVSKATNIIVKWMPRIKLSVQTLYKRSGIASYPALKVVCMDSGLRQRVHGVKTRIKKKEGLRGDTELIHATTRFLPQVVTNKL